MKRQTLEFRRWWRSNFACDGIHDFKNEWSIFILPEKYQKKGLLFLKNSKNPNFGYGFARGSQQFPEDLLINFSEFSQFLYHIIQN